MNIIKRIIYLLAIAIIIVIICIIILLKGNVNNKENQIVTNVISINNENESNINNIFDEIPEKYEEEIITTLSIVERRVIYFSVEECINKFINYLNQNKYEEAYSIIDQKYIASHNFTIENLKMKNYDNRLIITKIMEIDLDSEKNNSLYYIFLNGNNEASFIVSVNYKKMIFAIIPDNDVPLDYEDINQEHDLNKYTEVAVNNEEYARRLLADYVEKSLYCTEIAYEYLEKDYKQKKFGTFEEYNNYIIKNANMLNLYDAKNVKGPDEFATYEEWLSYFNTIKLLELDKYLIKERDGYTEYTLIDTYGNYYIFNEKSVMNYEVLLDTYTTSIPAFIEKYYEQDDEQKVRMNVYKFYDAITDEDYKYAYNTLSDILKNDKFPNQANFETYIKEIYLTEEAINESEVEKVEQDLFICKVNISEDETVKELNFKVSLLPDSEFSILDIY